MLVEYGIPSRENQAKEGLTLCVKLEHFHTLDRHISLRFIKEK